MRQAKRQAKSSDGKDSLPKKTPKQEAEDLAAAQAHARRVAVLVPKLTAYLKANPRHRRAKYGASAEDITHEAVLVLLEETDICIPTEPGELDTFFKRLMRRVEARNRRRHRRRQNAEDQATQDPAQRHTEQDQNRAELLCIAIRAAIRLAKKPYRYRQALLLLVSAKVDKKDNETLALYLKCSTRMARRIKDTVMKTLTACATEFDSEN
jgi:DNA-directed RNA polymerase specialized sigma24 family protein